MTCSNKLSFLSDNKMRLSAIEFHYAYAFVVARPILLLYNMVMGADREGGKRLVTQ